MTEQFTDLLEQYNQNPNNYEDFVLMNTKCLEQILVVHNALTSFVHACVPLSNTDNPSQQLQYIISQLHRNNYYSDVYIVDGMAGDEVVDVLWSDSTAKPGECDEVTLTLLIKDNEVCVSKFVEFGMHGEDYPMECSLDDVVYTLNKYSVKGLDKK